MSAGGKATLRMSPQTNSAPRRGVAGASTSRGSARCRSAARRRRRRPAGRQRPRRAYFPAASSRLASRPWPQPMSSTREPGAIRPSSRRWRNTGPGAACRGRSAARTGRRGRYEALACLTTPARPLPPPHGSRAPAAARGRGAGARGRASGSVVGRAARPRRCARAAPAARRGPPAPRPRSAPRGRRAAAGCRPRPGRRTRRAGTPVGSRRVS